MNTFLKIYDAVLEVILKAYFWMKRNPRQTVILLAVLLALILIFSIAGGGGQAPVEVQPEPTTAPVLPPDDSLLNQLLQLGNGV